jgi:hypothetical protein
VAFTCDFGRLWLAARESMMSERLAIGIISLIRNAAWYGT